MKSKQTKLNSKQVADFFGVTKDTLRFYEKKGVIPKVSRDKNGYRIYTDRELNWIYLALSLKRAGLSLEKIIKFTSLFANPTADSLILQKAILRDQISEIDNKLKNLTTTREILQGKLDNFDNHLAKIETGELDAKYQQKEWKNYEK